MEKHLGLALFLPKTKRPSAHVAGRAFLRGCLSDLALFKRGQSAKKVLYITSEKSEKVLGKDKTASVRAFWCQKLVA